jgi:hypothetical protein
MSVDNRLKMKEKEMHRPIFVSAHWCALGVAGMQQPPSPAPQLCTIQAAKPFHLIFAREISDFWKVSESLFSSGILIH